MNKKARDKFQNRLSELIDEGNDLSRFEIKSDMGSRYFDSSVRDQVVSWQVRVKNIIHLVFGNESTQYKYLIEQTPEYLSNTRDLKVYAGLLSGAHKDLNDGFLEGLEFTVSSDVFDSVIQEAKYLCEHGYKDPSAVLGRVVLEKSLIKLAEIHGIESNQKASVIE